MAALFSFLDEQAAWAGQASLLASCLSGLRQVGGISAGMQLQI